MEWAKKNGILGEAAKAFAQFGFKKASIDQIARAAGVAKGTIYNACRNKEDLFYQVLHREVTSWTAEVSRAIDPRKPADELLDTVFVESVRYMNDRPLVRELLFGRIHAILPSLRDELEDLRAFGRGVVEQILRLGIKQGRFRDDLDVEYVAVLLQDISLAYFVLHAHRPLEPEKFARRRKVGLDLILNGIRTADATH